MTDTAVLTLTDFLLARIAEDAAVALEVEAEDVRVQYVVGYEHDGPDTSFWADYDGARPSVSVGSARVLAECEAKRRIVGFHHPSQDKPGPEWLPYCEGCWVEGGMDGAPSHPCRTVKFLALPYADHPDYQQEWKP